MRVVNFIVSGVLIVTGMVLSLCMRAKYHVWDQYDWSTDHIWIWVLVLVFMVVGVIFFHRGIR